MYLPATRWPYRLLTTGPTGRSAIQWAEAGAWLCCPQVGPGQCRSVGVATHQKRRRLVSITSHRPGGLKRKRTLTPAEDTTSGERRSRCIAAGGRLLLKVLW